MRHKDYKSYATIVTLIKHKTRRSLRKRVNKMEVANENNSEFEGYGLFNDIEDKELRTRNRAVSMTNIFELHSKEGLLNALSFLLWLCLYLF